MGETPSTNRPGRDQQVLLREKLIERSQTVRREPTSYPATSAQSHMWLEGQLAPDSPTYNNAACARLRGPLDPGKLEEVLRQIARRHSPLRSLFRQGEDGKLFATITDGEPRLAVLDVSGVPAAGRETEALRLATEAARRPFELDQSTPLRALLVRLAPDDHLLVIIVHHIVSDGWSFRVLLGELLELYAGGPPRPLATSFFDHAQSQRLYEKSRRFREGLDYWRAGLAGAPHLLDLPRDRPRPPARSARGARLEFAMTAGEAADLHRLCRAHSVTPFVCMYAGLVALLQRYTGARDLCVGTPILGREDEASEALIGLFVNMVVLRAGVDPDEPFADLLRRAGTVVASAFDHGRVPFERVLEALAPPRDPAYTPLYQVILSANNAPAETIHAAGLEITPVDLELGTAMTDLAISLRLGRDRVSGFVDYSTEIFDRASVDQLVRHWRQLLRSAVAAPATAIGRLDLLDAADRAILAGWSRAPEPELDPPACLHRLVLDRAAAAPSAIAVRDGGVPHTYADLAAASAAIAARLRRAGVRPGDRVALFADRSFALMAALVGVNRVGAAYVPVPLDTPDVRASSLVERAGCRAVLCDRAALARMPAAIPLDEALAAAPGAEGDHNDPDGLAYLLYTSGSTGAPKGVMVRHRAAASRVRWKQGSYPMRSSDRVLQATTVAFDPSIWEIFGALSAGATLVMLGEGAGKNPADWAELLLAEEITVIHAVPSWMRMLCAAAGARRFPAVRQVFCQGEALDREVVSAVHATMPQALLCNTYGPTEAVISQTVHECDRQVDSGPVPIGSPIGDASVHLLDERLEPVPPGVVGEIYIGGSSLATGYFGEPELTRTRFVPDPFAGDAEALMYRTGDLARWQRDGELLFLGRRDFQIKLSGYRIELEEIEHALAEHPGVEQCAVVMVGEAEARKLVAHVVGGASGAELREHLLARLPSYMVPSVFVRARDLPVTQNGKLDRAALARREVTEVEAPAEDAGWARPRPVADQQPPPRDEVPTAAPAVARQVNLADWFHRPAWRRLPEVAAGRPEPAVVWLFCDQRGTGDRLAQALRRRGDQVVCMRPGASHAIAGDDIFIDPAADADRLVADLVARAFEPTTILYLWPLDHRLEGDTPADRLASLARAVDRSYHPLVDVLRALAARAPSARIRVLVAARGLHAVHPAETGDPCAAPLAGAAAVLPREIAGLTMSVVDLDPDGGPDDWSGALALELQAAAGEPVVALRGGVRWGRAFPRAPLAAQPEVQPLFRTRGVYLVTGGLGGLGLSFADYLSSCYQARLALVTRRQLPERSRWGEHIAHGGELAGLLERVLLLEARGSEVEIVTADLGDPAAALAVVARVRERFGAIHGVIHAAGVAGYRLAALRERGEAAEVLGPKLVGALALVESLAGERSLDFIALFSSLAAHAGGVGALDYAAANQFLERLAGRPRVVTIAWGPWRDVGLAARWQPPADLAEGHRAALAGGIRTGEGVQAFVRALASGWSQVIVSPQPLEQVLDPGFDALASLSQVQRHPPPLAPPPVAAPALPPAAVAAPPATDSLVEEVTEVWREVLQVKDIKPTDNFFDLGGHSLLLLHVANRLAKRFGRLVPLALLVTRPTVEACVEALRARR